MGEKGKVYVGNLPWVAKEEDLRDLFKKFGEIDDCVVIMERNEDPESRRPPRSKGFGFVTFREPEDAEDAIAKMMDYDYDGRPMNVKHAKPRGEGGRRGGYGGGGGGGYRGDRGYGGGGGGGYRGGDRDGGYGGGSGGGGYGGGSYGGGRSRGYGGGGGRSSQRDYDDDGGYGGRGGY